MESEWVVDRWISVRARQFHLVKEKRFLDPVRHGLADFPPIGVGIKQIIQLLLLDRRQLVQGILLVYQTQFPCYFPRGAGQAVAQGVEAFGTLMDQR